MTEQLLPRRRDVSAPEDLELAYVHPSDPHVRVNFVTSLDGAVEVDGRSASLGGPADRAAFMAMRAVADVIMVGAGTARAENYGPVRLEDPAQQRRIERHQKALPPLAVVTFRGDLDPQARLFSADGAVIVLTTSRVLSERSDLAEVAEVIACGDDRVDMVRAVGELRDRGFGRVLCEGGPALMRSLLGVDLVDELCLTIAPVLAGSQNRNLSGPDPLPHLERFRLESLIEGDSMLFTRYARLGPS